MRVVGVAGPNAARRKRIAAAHGIPPKRCFTDWKPVSKPAPGMKASEPTP